MLKSLMMMFQKNTKTCDHCGCSINPKVDAALCLHGSDNGIPFEQWVCEPCCEKIAYEYEQEFADEEVNIAEQD